ncbi:TonB-dependent receptor domain-containing protein [Massilia sp. TS11]|uniref:TonB-dependent receptor domain-containing protein n=1 Tax=Massilia sp. TS11 TaxID=2908003 RepID=UPI001EDA1789|nr:TonB-dependent receptor [Massilia sp. TS11]MCG2585993.1 TonB-dependent receptor [Massilia sp. TS11]
MTQEKILARSLRLMFSGGLLAGLVAPAMAQQAPEAQKVEQVFVTGTRITSPGATSNSPISSLNAEEIKSGQPMAVEEFFKNLPSAVPAVGPGTNNGTGGGATIDLRGLGANRTLVLVNGRRMVPFNLNGTVDTNSIPIALLSRVDLVTGGASVVYGADAVSGVVNFNLKRNFTGIDLSGEQGISAEGDAKRRRLDLTMGATLDGGKGNVALSIGKTKVDPLMAGDRPIGKTTTNSVNGLFSGSSTTIPGVVSIAKGTNGTGSLAGSQQINPSTGVLSPLQDSGTYNTNPLNYFVTGLERTQATALGNYRVNDNLEVYSEVFYTTSFVAAQLAESGTFGNTYQVPIGNPFIPDAARKQICDWRGISAANCVVGNTTLVPMASSRRFVELGPRYQTFDNKTLQYTIGAKGSLPFDWNYDAYWTRGTADQIQSRKNWGSLSKVKQALNAVSTTACVDASNGCVPLNIWGGAGSITPAMLNFLNLSTLLSQKVEQDVGLASISGDLGDKLVSPFANTPINMSLTLEQRKVSAGTLSDQPSQIQGEVLGTGAPTPDRRGSFRLREEATEFALPLVKDKFLAKAINLELGYRHTNFDSGSSASKSYGSYKYGGEWAVVDTWRLRGMVQKATRSPNVNELFAPQVTGLSNVATDPCQLDLIKAGDANTAGTLSNLCRLTGVPTNVIGAVAKPSSGQINNLSGGNPELGPEVAKTKTIGFVWEPLPKMVVTVDHYEIKITDAVSSPSTTDMLDGCYNPTYNPTYAFNAACANIFRNPQNGTLNGVESKGVFTASSNLGKLKSAGYDLSVAYRLPLKQLGADPKWGNLDLSLMYNQVQTNTFQATPAAINRNCLGYYSVACGAPNYKRKWNQRTSWSFGEFVFGYNWRHVSGMIEEPGGTDFLPAFSTIPAYNYVDLSAVWNVSKNLRLNFSVNNAGNKQPPLVGNNIAGTSVNGGNTLPQAYDTVGRAYTFGASLKF